MTRSGAIERRRREPDMRGGAPVAGAAERRAAGDFERFGGFDRRAVA
jgi:hypothetical protein